MSPLFHAYSLLAGPARRLAGDRRGVTAVVTAIALTMLMGFSGLATDVVIWEVSQRSLQGVADQAALAAATAYRSKADTVALGDSTTAKNGAYATAIRSGYSASAITLAAYNNGSTCTNDGCLKVTLTQQQRRFFTAIFFRSPINVSASAVGTCKGCGNGSFSTSSNGGNPCVMALDASGNGVVTISGTPTMSLNQCDLYNNSPNTAATILNGQGTIEGCSISNPCGSQAFLAQPNDPSGNIDVPVVNNASPAPDPYAGLTPPTVSSPCQAFPNPPPASGIPSGTYCPGNINSSYNSGVVKFADNAVIVINQHNGLVVTGTGNVSFNGTGVTLYVLGGGDISANSTLNLTAPTTGPYAGIVTWFGDSSAVTWAGTNSSSFKGVIYAPTATVTYRGTSASASTCTRLVAASVGLVGTSTAVFDNSGCPTVAGPVLTSSGVSGTTSYTGSPMLVQ